jgi:phage terminase large subunit
MAPIEYEARPQFIPFHARTQRWAVLCTHRRAGKTVALVNDIVEKSMMCQLRKPQYAYVGPTFTQAKRIAWTYLKDYTEQYWTKAPSESELKISMVGDRTLYCLGSDNPDSLRGMYLDGVVEDEYALFRPSVHTQIIRPALSDRQGWAVFASTPRGKNQFHKIYKTAVAQPNAYYSLLLKASDSHILPDDELHSLRKDMDDDEYAQEYECSFDAALKGAIYSDEVNLLFAEGRIVAHLYEPNLPTHVVFDLGFTDATVGIFWQEHPEHPRVRIVAVEATQGKDIFHHIDALNQKSQQIQLGEVYLPHDAKARNLQTGRSIVEQFLENGIRPSMVPAHKVRDRLAAARKLFPEIAIEAEDPSEGCDDLVEGLKAYRREWDDNLLMFSDKPLHDWASDYADAFGYLCVVAAPKFARTETKTADMAALHHLSDRSAKVVRSSMVNPGLVQYLVPHMTLDNLHQDREAALKGSRTRVS